MGDHALDDEDRAHRIAQRDALFRDLAAALDHGDGDEPITEPIPIIGDATTARSWLHPS